MALYGYVRVSTIDQAIRLQEAALRAAGYGIVCAEKVSGTKRDGRAKLALLLAFLRPGDTLVVTRIDRLARSIKDLQDIVETLKQRGSTLTRTRRKALRSLASAAPATLTAEAYLDSLERPPSAQMSQVSGYGASSALSPPGQDHRRTLLVNAARGRCLRRRWRLADRRIVTR
jgi:hypothetical protein